MLSYYIAETFQFSNIANEYPDILNCWEVPKLETLLTYYMSCYLAELVLIF